MQPITQVRAQLWCHRARTSSVSQGKMGSLHSYVKGTDRAHASF